MGPAGAEEVEKTREAQAKLRTARISLDFGVSSESQCIVRDVNRVCTRVLTYLFTYSGSKPGVPSKQVFLGRSQITAHRGRSVTIDPCVTTMSNISRYESSQRLQTPPLRLELTHVARPSTVR